MALPGNYTSVTITPPPRCNYGALGCCAVTWSKVTADDVARLEQHQHTCLRHRIELAMVPASVRCVCCGAKR